MDTGQKGFKFNKDFLSDKTVSTSISMQNILYSHEFSQTNLSASLSVDLAGTSLVSD